MLCFKAQWSVDYTTTELDGKALFIVQWYYSYPKRVQRYIKITRLSTYHDIFNSQKNHGQKY